jgi:hypothetical protein
VELGHLERLVSSERGEDRGEAPSEHRLAGPRRADEQEVVPTGGGDLERAPRVALAAHVAEIGALRRRLHHIGLPPHDLRNAPVPQERDDVVERLGAHDLEVFDQTRLGDVRGRYDDAPEPRAGDRDRDREHSRRRDQRPLQREFAHEREVGGPHLRHLTGRDEDTHRDGKIEPGTVLAEVPR